MPVYGDRDKKAVLMMYGMITWQHYNAPVVTMGAWCGHHGNTVTLQCTITLLRIEL